MTAVTITQSAPTTDTVATAASRAYTNHLVTVGNGAVSYAESPSTYSGTVLVFSSGAVTTRAHGDWLRWRNSCANSSGCSYGLYQFTRWTSSSSTGTATATNDNTTASGSGVGALTVAQYGSDPVAAPTFSSTG